MESAENEISAIHEEPIHTDKANDTVEIKNELERIHQMLAKKGPVTVTNPSYKLKYIGSS